MLNFFNRGRADRISGDVRKLVSDPLLTERFARAQMAILRRPENVRLLAAELGVDTGTVQLVLSMMTVVDQQAEQR